MRTGVVKLATVVALAVATSTGLTLALDQKAEAKTRDITVSHSTAKDCNVHRSLLVSGNQTVIKGLIRTAGAKNVNKITVLNKCKRTGSTYSFNVRLHFIGLPNVGN